MGGVYCLVPVFLRWVGSVKASDVLPHLPRSPAGEEPAGVLTCLGLRLGGKRRFKQVEVRPQLGALEHII